MLNTKQEISRQTKVGGKVMNIEKLKELKSWVSDLRKFGVSEGNEIIVLIDAAIARQSATSEEVQEAIKQIEMLSKAIENDMHWRSDKLMKSLETAITALQAYQPWVSVKDRLPESEKSVLLLCEVRPMGMKYVCIGYYAAPKSVESNCDDIEMLEYDEDTDAYYLQEGYYEEIRNWDEYSSIAIGDFVIGWRPLPDHRKENEHEKSV